MSIQSRIKKVVSSKKGPLIGAAITMTGGHLYNVRSAYTNLFATQDPSRILDETMRRVRTSDAPIVAARASRSEGVGAILSALLYKIRN